MKALALLVFLACPSYSMTVDPGIAAGEIDTGKIGAGAVDTGKIATDAVTAPKLLNQAASLSKVSGGFLTTDGINTFSVGGSTLAVRDGAVVPAALVVLGTSTHIGASNFTGNLGVGTLLPTAMQENVTPSAAMTKTALRLRNPSNDLLAGASLEFYSGTTIQKGGWIHHEPIGSNQGDLILGGANVGFSTQVYLQGVTGNVGINTSAPLSTLDVNGAATVRGAFTLKEGSGTIRHASDARLGFDTAAAGRAAIDFKEAGVDKIYIHRIGSSEGLGIRDGGLEIGNDLAGAGVAIRNSAGERMRVDSAVSVYGAPFTVANASATVQGDALITGTVTASGYGLRNSLVHNTTDFAGVPSIAQAAYSCISTVTVTLRGSRFVLVQAHMTLNNAAGGARDYTYSLLKDGVLLDEEYVQTSAGTSTEFVMIDYHADSSTAGAQSYCIQIKSSNATGTQTARHPHIVVKEYP